MAKRIAVIQGHPDPQGGHFGHALADAYVTGAREAGHHVDVISVARLEFPLLRSKEEFDSDVVPGAIHDAQDVIRSAGHLLIMYPLWLGSMPARLQGFLEQVFRPGFAIGEPGGKVLSPRRFTGKTARIVVTMGMPAFFYRWYFGAYSVKSLKRGVLGFCGVSPIRATLIGNVESPDGARRIQWLEKMSTFGRQAR